MLERRNLNNGNTINAEVNAPILPKAVANPYPRVLKLVGYSSLVKGNNMEKQFFIQNLIKNNHPLKLCNSSI